MPYSLRVPLERCLQIGKWVAGGGRLPAFGVAGADAGVIDVA